MSDNAHLKLDSTLEIKFKWVHSLSQAERRLSLNQHAKIKLLLTSNRYSFKIEIEICLLCPFIRFYPLNRGVLTHQMREKIRGRGRAPRMSLAFNCRKSDRRILLTLKPLEPRLRVSLELLFIAGPFPSSIFLRVKGIKLVQMDLQCHE